MLSNFFSQIKNRYRLMLLAISGGYFYVFISAWLDPMQEKTLCVYKNVTGHPCPGCGMTRSTISFFSGRLVESFFYNPLAIVVNIMALAAFFWIIIDLIQNKTRFDSFIKKKIHPVLLIIIVLLVLANWYWNFLKGY